MNELWNLDIKTMICHEEHLQEATYKSLKGKRYYRGELVMKEFEQWPVGPLVKKWVTG